VRVERRGEEVSRAFLDKGWELTGEKKDEKVPKPIGPGRQDEGRSKLGFKKGIDRRQKKRAFWGRWGVFLQ